MSKTDDRGRREFLKGGAAAMLAASCWGWPNAAANAEDEASVHGMLIVGQQTVFLSHLPMFGSPHDFQVILEATFTKPGSDPQADYFADRKSKDEKIYTLEPKPFVLPRLAAAAPLRSFKASVYRGHFERFPNRRAQDAARIAQDVDVTVTRVIHFRKFDPSAAKPAQLEYLLFGKGAELFLAHLITRPPDFDQILSVKAPNQAFTDQELGQGVSVVVPGRSNSAAKRIRGTGAVTAQIKAAGGAGPKALQLQPGTEFYLEQGELAS
ncbi:MAG TPA: hypothetical protein VH397_16965 [Xanthobacteraceae bacterium]|jgi:hypothetical protein